jgi:adenylosuccinate synthase
MAEIINRDVVKALYESGWFRTTGSYVLVDGQYGSTGKGVAAALLAAYAKETALPIDGIMSNAGPNSGHTAIIPGGKWINKQIPIATSVLDHLGRPTYTYLNGGAVIAMDELLTEWKALSEHAQDLVAIHPHAAEVTDADKSTNTDLVKRIASTGKGTGPAAAARILRTGRVYGDNLPLGDIPDKMTPSWAMRAFDPYAGVVFVETSQGFSLGINSGFYPHCTHRECTVGQAMADARLPLQTLNKVMMVVRTYPIRVGNTENSSGDCYPDQRELTWEEVGQEPEYTTVTKRVRRIFSWSRMQFVEAVSVNRPDTILLNFANYMKKHDLEAMLSNINDDLDNLVNLSAGQYKKPLLLLGFGPSTTDVVTVEGTR